MAKSKECCGHGYHKIMKGVMLLVFGGIKYMGYSWEEAVIGVGALMVLKGLYYQFR